MLSEGRDRKGRGRWEELCVCDSGLLSGKGRDPSGSAGSLTLQSDVRVSAPAVGTQGLHQWLRAYHGADSAEVLQDERVWSH